MEEGARQTIPAGRVASPDEIAAPIEWLCGDDSGYVNGQIMLVDGGMDASYMMNFAQRLVAPGQR
jgi:enoyl-[acyl-carrier protein] reductase III